MRPDRLLFSSDKRVLVVWRAAGFLLLLAICLSLTGCGNGLAQVSGQVTVDGQPLRGGKGDVRVTIQFRPTDGIGAAAVGLADEYGHYMLATGSQAGIRPGDYFVSCSQSVLGKPKSPSETPDPKYANAGTSGLKFTVEPGKNEINLSLDSAKKTSSRRGA
jgi:hypothetical protein